MFLADDLMGFAGKKSSGLRRRMHQQARASRRLAAADMKDSR